MQNLEITSLDNPLIYDIISDRDSVLDRIMRNIRKIHPYAITEPKGENGRWQTSYKENGVRKNIKAPTEELLIKKLIKIYSNMNNKVTFYSLYTEWLDYKSTITNSPNTIKRHKQHYNKYFLNSKLHNMAIKSIDEITLEKISNGIVKDYNLSRKEWGNVKTILNGMFEYAYRRKYITENPVSNVRISVKFRQIVKKTGKTQTYNTDELNLLNEYLDKMYAETHDTSFLCVKLNFLLGLRVGELVALKWTDIDEEHIHIVREEVRNQDTNEYEVVEHTKTHTDRFVVFPKKAQKILKQIPQENEYIFVRDGERLHARQIAYVLEKYAERNGLIVKSTHKMRKTYASNLNAHGVPLDSIREMLGHSNLTTTLSYIYNPLSERKTIDLINEAL